MTLKPQWLTSHWTPRQKKEFNEMSEVEKDWLGIISQLQMALASHFANPPKERLERLETRKIKTKN